MVRYEGYDGYKRAIITDVTIVFEPLTNSPTPFYSIYAFQVGLGLMRVPWAGDAVGGGGLSVSTRQCLTYTARRLLLAPEPATKPETHGYDDMRDTNGTSCTHNIDDSNDTNDIINISGSGDNSGSIGSSGRRKVNIFFLYNTLWGLARMGSSASALDVQYADIFDDATKASSMRGSVRNTFDEAQPLSWLLFNSAVRQLHSFLPEQYGGVIWALGALGYSLRDQSPGDGENMENIDRSTMNTGNEQGEVSARIRVLAVLGRVLPKLNVRSAAYVLWGLQVGMKAVLAH